MFQQTGKKQTVYIQLGWNLLVGEVEVYDSISFSCIKSFIDPSCCMDVLKETIPIRMLHYRKSLNKITLY